MCTFSSFCPHTSEFYSATRITFLEVIHHADQKSWSLLCRKKILLDMNIVPHREILVLLHKAMLLLHTKAELLSPGLLFAKTVVVKKADLVSILS